MSIIVFKRNSNWIDQISLKPNKLKAPTLETFMGVGILIIAPSLISNFIDYVEFMTFLTIVITLNEFGDFINAHWENVLSKNGWSVRLNVKMFAPNYSTSFSAKMNRLKPALLLKRQEGFKMLMRETSEQYKRYVNELLWCFICFEWA